MKKLTIAVDYDGTLAHSDVYGNEIAMELRLVNYLKKLKEEGHQLILWTCREGAWLKEAIERCKELGLEFDAVNESLHSRKTCGLRKVIADVYIDDRSIKPEEFLRSVL